MAYTYTALIQYLDSDDRFANLTETPTVTALDTAGNSISSPSITNLVTGVYKVSVTQDDLEDVVFTVVPHVDDQDNFPDVAVMQDKVYHVADEVLVDTGTTLPAVLDAIKGAGWTDEDLVAIKAAVDDIWSASSRTLTQSATEIIASVSGSSITQIRGNTWDFGISDLTLDANKQQFAIKLNNIDTDEKSLLFIDDTGLVYINGEEAGDATKASLSYDGTTLTIKVDASITALLPTGSFCYGIQSISATPTVSEIYGGTFTIVSDTVRATE